MRTYVLARTAIFIALGALFKASLAALPNVELVTFWVFVNTMLYGAGYGAFIGVASNVVSDIFFTGFGPWTIFTSLAFALSALFFHVWAGRKISPLPIVFLVLVSLLVLCFLSIYERDGLSRVAGWGFFALGVSPFLFRVLAMIHGKLSDTARKAMKTLLCLSIGAFLAFILQDFLSWEQAIVLLAVWCILVLLRTRIRLLLSSPVRRLLGKRTTSLMPLFDVLSKNKNIAWAALISTVLWDLFTVITMSVLLFGQPLGAALYAQYGIMPPTFYPFGIVHAANNVLVIALLGPRTIDLIERAEKPYL